MRWIQNPRFHNKIGLHAGRISKSSNYYQTKFDGKLFQNHRIIFFLHNGFCPDCVDHIDGDPTNNRINNLREATRSDNCCNKKMHKTTYSGHKGVYLHPSGKYWNVQIMKNSKSISKNFTFDKFQEACDYADEQRKILHGDFSRI